MKPKKLLSFILATVMAISLLPTFTITASAAALQINSMHVVASAGLIDGIPWTVTEQGKMTETQPGVYELTVNNVEEGTARFYFSINESLVDNFGGNITSETANYLGTYISFGIYSDNSTVKIVLDLRNFDYDTKMGAIYKLYVNGEQINSNSKNITLGKSALSGYDSTTNKYKYVYYGTYGGNPIKWRILSTDTGLGNYYWSGTPYTPTNTPTDPVDGEWYEYPGEHFIYLAKSNEYYEIAAGSQMPLLSEYGLTQMAFDVDGIKNDGQIYPSDWRYSDAWNWCNDTTDATSFISSSFTDLEKAYLLKASMQNSYQGFDYSDELKGDTFFFLSIGETQLLNDRVAKMVSDPDGNPTSWWLRTSDSTSTQVICMNEYGSSNDSNVNVMSTEPAARPACNLDSSKILFTSAANGGKNTTSIGTLSSNGTNATGEYKLTMLDTSREFTVTEKTATGDKGEELKFNYENAETDENEYISAMIVQNGKVLYYGQLAKSTAASGTVDFTIPSDISYGTYQLRLFNEQINGDYKTDYSSAFGVVDLSVEKPKATFTTEPKANTLTYNGNEQELVTAGEPSGGNVMYSLEKNGTYSEAIPKRENADTYTVWYYIKGDSSHSDSDKERVEVKISPKNIEEANITLGDELTYNGTEQKQKFSVTDNGKVLKGQYADDIPLNTSRDYTIYNGKGTYGANDYKIEIIGNGNYTGSKSADFEIVPRPVTIKWTDTTGWVYDGKPKTVTAEVSNICGKDTVNLTLSGDSLTQTDKGTYTATVTAVDNLNYTIKKGINLTKEWSISKADDNEITGFSINGWTYGETANAPTATANYGTPTYSYSTEENGTYTDTVPTEAGTYWVKATVVGTENYAEASSTPVSFTIAKKAVSGATVGTFDSMTYNGQEQTPIAEVTVDGLTVTGTWSKVTNVKDKTTFTANGNFEGELTDKTTGMTPATPVEITKTTAMVKSGRTLADAVVTYGEIHGVDNTPLGGTFAWVDNPPTTAQMTFTPNDTDNYLPITINVDVSTYTLGGGLGVGGYTVKFEIDGETAATQKVTVNGTAKAPETPTTDGYVFDGWYTDKDYTNKFDFNTKVTKNITLYAKWTEDKAEEPSDDKKDDEQKPNDDNTNDEPQTSEWKNPFTDVKENDWFFDSVKYANENRLMSGTANTTFAPNETLTRGMLVTILYRLAGEPAVNKSIPFADVTADSYYMDAVIWAEQNGIVSGISETEFAPDENITREQIAVILYRYAKAMGYDVSVGESTNILSYTDFDEISEYAIEAVQYAVGMGLMKGKTESTLNPKDNATRAETAAILQRFIESNK